MQTDRHQLEAADDPLATLSHALYTPLTAIIGSAETLQCSEQPLSEPERQECLQTIRGAADELALVIDRLLQGAQLNTGTQPIELGPRRGRSSCSLDGRRHGSASGELPQAEGGGG